MANNETSNGKETTSIRIDPKIWKEAKLKAVQKDMSIGEFIEELIRKEIGKR